MGSKKYSVKLIQYISKKGKYPLMNVSVLSLPFELRPVQERHNLLMMAYWITTRKRKINEVVKVRTIPANILYRDSDADLKKYVITVLLGSL